MEFMLKHKLVVTEAGKVLGEVVDSQVVWPDLRVTKLVLRRSLFGGELLVGVDAIVRVEGDRIIVRDALVKEPAKGEAQPVRVSQQVANVLSRENVGK